MKTSQNENRAYQILLVLIISLLITLLFEITVNGQSVGINNPNPNPSALLDLTSSSKGMLVPRMTTAQRNAIGSPATGLLVFDNSLNGFWYYNGTVWKSLADNSTGWTTTGNQGTNDATNFIGTTDNVPLNFRINNQRVGRIDPALSNVFLGKWTGINNTTGNGNVFIGDGAGYSNTSGAWNTMLGRSAGSVNTTGAGNVFIGLQSGGGNTSGWSNTYLGNWAGSGNFTGFQNTCTGFNAGLNATGNNNSIYGVHAGGGTGNSNTFFGSSSGINNMADENCFLGAYTGTMTTTGNENLFAGTQAAQLNSSGSQNVYMGYRTGYNMATGNYNTYVGARADGSASVSKAVAIGYNAQVTASNSLVLGGTGIDAVKVGIGVTAPQAELEVNGYTILGNGAPKIKMKTVYGTTASTQGAGVTIAHGLTLAKILSVSVLVEATTSTFVPASYDALSGYEFDYRLNTSGIVITNSAANAASILSKPVRVLITYEQ